MKIKELKIKRYSLLKNIIELFVALYFILGGIKQIGRFSTPYISYTISIIIQIMVIIFILSDNKVKIKSGIIILYGFNLSMIVLIILNFFILNINLIVGINRIVPLISIFGFILTFAVVHKKYIDFNKVLEKVIYGYCIVGIIVILDAISFYVSGISLWPPVHYLGARFSGPFFDSNFLGLFYGSLLIVIIFYDKIKVKYKNIIISIFIFNLILSLSWTSIGLLILSILINKIVKFRSLFLKQILIIISYLVFIYIFSQKFEQYKSIFIELLLPILPFNEGQLAAKFLSFEYRITTQLEALNIVKNNLMGMGPRTLVPLLGRDTHNSYIGFLFELGIPGLLLLVANVIFTPKNYSKVLDILSSYIFLMSLTLNVHYSVVYMILVSLLIMIVIENNNHIVLNDV